ncbi:hypothetical protein P9B03_13535 [Metasolibacillus meyeri]|uniref:Uncharacterized protein n=1 Tax=Metasolibacillus meyeri TaxID=1071052 RepID=A0AAW9NXK3_9BACL|nr:hypothetical protein [Metasolibacillus meyeri]MEC1179515.1 hypothetical protein [Metasolibacillus meyeri]
MKKVFFKASFLLCFSLALFVFNSHASANELDTDINAGLSNGEIVVDTFTELIPTNGVIREEIFFENDDLISTQERRLRWFAVSSTYQGLTYGAWQPAGASTISGGRLSASHTSTVSHRYSGTLKVPIKTLDSVVGFDVTKSWSETVSYTSTEYPTNGRYRLEYRHVYQKYQVKQEQKYDSRVEKVYDTQYVYPEKWIERQYRVVQF